jgi:hypothetical protein
MYQQKVKATSWWFSFEMLSVSLIGLAFLFLSLAMLCFVKKAPVVASFVMSMLFVFTSYLSLMLAML